jgi:hypothetical protein
MQAPRFLVVSRVRDRIAWHAAIPGPDNTIYTLTRADKQFGGGHLWQDRQAAAAWFDPACFERRHERRDAEPEIRAVVLTGAGDKAVCAGADLGRGSGSFQFDPSVPHAEFADLLRYAWTTTLPLVARIDGHCLAGGMGFMAMCDLAVAAEHVSFGRVDHVAPRPASWMPRLTGCFSASPASHPQHCAAARR